MKRSFYARIAQGAVLPRAAPYVLVSLLVLLSLMTSACGGPSAATDNSSAGTVVVRTTAVQWMSVSLQTVAPAEADAAAGVQPAVTEVLRFPGVVRAVERATLTFQVAGVLRDRPLNIGQRVAAGAHLAALYNPELEPGRDTALARAEELAVQLQQAARELQRFDDLFARGVVSAQEREDRQLRRDALQAALSSAQSDLRQREQWQAEMVLRAPFAGTVEALLAEPGEFVSPGQPILRLSAPTQLEIEVGVPAFMLDGLALGAQVRVWHALSGRELQADIREFGASSNGGVLYPVIVGLDDPALRPGEPVEVGLPRLSAPALAVPLSAVMRSALGPAVFRVREAHAERVPVRVTALRGEWALLAEGLLQQGDQVVHAGLSRLADGDPVSLLP